MRCMKLIAMDDEEHPSASEVTSVGERVQHALFIYLPDPHVKVL